MNPIKLIRKLGKTLRGGVSFGEMFLGIFLGFAVGMTPGVNLTLFVFIALLLMLNANMALGLVALAFGKVLCIALAPLTYHIGHVMIHNLGMAGVVQAMSETPVLALLGFDVYSLLGGLPLIVVVGGGLAGGMASAITKARTKISSAHQQSEKLQKAHANKVAQFGLRIAFGKQKEALADMADKKSPLIRKGRLIAGLVILVVLVGLQYLFMDKVATQGLTVALTRASGAEVNIESANLSLGDGKIQINGIQVTDAANPANNQFQADRIVADIDVKALLTKRFVFGNIECDGMRLDAPRATPGKVYQKPEPKPEPKPTVPVDLGGEGDKIQEYYAQVKKLNERFSKVREYLEKRDPSVDRKETGAEEADSVSDNLAYLIRSAKDVLAEHPVWVIRKITISNLKVSEDLPGFTVEGLNLSSHPSLYPEPAKFTVKPDEDAIEKLKGMVGDKIKEQLGDKVTESLGDKLPGGLNGLFGK